MKWGHSSFTPRSLPRHLTVPETSLWRNLDVSATRFPDKPALFFHGGTTTYREFHRQTELLAGFLQQRCGVRRGDRVALFLHNSPQFVIAYYAVLRADAAVVPVNCMNTTPELEHILRDSGATTLFTAQELLPRAAPLLGVEGGAAGPLRHAIVACYADYADATSSPPLPEALAAPRRALDVPGATAWHEALAAALEPAPHTAGPDDLALIPYTSGTTGKPKGCTHRHRGVMHSALAIAHWHDVRQDACSLAALPLFHVTGMQNSMNMPIYAGAAIALTPRWQRDTALALIERHGVTNMTTVPAMIVDLLSGDAGHDLSSLRILGGGGAAMPEAVAAKLFAATGRTYLEGYGMTETMAPTHMTPGDRVKPGSFGVPVFDTDARVIDPESLADLPVGAVGEVIVAGPQVLDGYWNNPAENAQCFLERDGKRFLRTGDLARIDAEGYFFFVDRLKRMINAAGFKVWPAEVEALLYAHPAVQEACVISKRDARSGEIVKALIVAKPAARAAFDADELLAWARERLAAYKVPREIELVDSLPRSATGKIDWRLLQEQEAASR